VWTDEATKEFTQQQHAKFQFLYCLYVKKSEGTGTQEGFFEYVDKFLTEASSDATEGRKHVGQNIGLKFALSLIKEIYKVSPAMMKSALEHLYQALCESPAQSLYGTDVLAF
jgi:hypothetical protein